MYEDKTVEALEARMKVKVEKCGLVMSHSHPYLAASPDGLLDNDTVAEVKCPYTAAHKVISPATVPWSKLKDGCLTLDQSHSYYYQIQGEMFCTNRDKCVLVVYTIAGCAVITIEQDNVFTEQMLCNLSDFYATYFKKPCSHDFCRGTSIHITFYLKVCTNNVNLDSLTLTPDSQFAWFIVLRELVQIIFIV